MTTKLTNVTDDRIYKLFKLMPDFREWILDTKLFNVIVEQSNKDSPQYISTRIEAFSEDETLLLDLSNRKVKQPEDLPIEIIQKFYENYPKGKQGINITQQHQLTN